MTVLMAFIASKLSIIAQASDKGAGKETGELMGTFTKILASGGAALFTVLTGIGVNAMTASAVP